MSRISKKNIFLIFVAYTSSIRGFEYQPHLKTVHIKHSRDYLYNNIPQELKENTTYYRSLLEQTTPDTHSCGQRSVFHALALEDAMQRMREQNIVPDISLRFSLSSVTCYRHVYATINSMIQTEMPWFNLRAGTCGDQLARAANRYFPVLKDKLLPIYLYNEQLFIVDNGIPPYPSCLNAGKFSLDSRQYKPFRNSHEKRLQLSKLIKPFDISHFIALLDNKHWILASVMLNYKGEKRLLIIDSCNNFFQNYPSLQTLITLLNEEMHTP